MDTMKEILTISVLVGLLALANSALGAASRAMADAARECIY